MATRSGLTASRDFSADVVRHLREKKTLKEIGDLIGRGESFVSLVGQGKRSLTVEHLLAIENALRKPLPLLILEASQGTIPETLRKQYDTLHEILRKSGHLRFGR